MRTTLDIDDHLMTALRARNPTLSKTEAVELAIGEYLRRDSIERLLALAGTLEIDDVSVELRRLDRRA